MSITLLPLTPEIQTSQIISSIEIVQNLKSEETVNNCSICLTEYSNDHTIENIPLIDKVRRLSCKHDFHLNCIYGWISENKDSCPNCRAKIEKAEIIDISLPFLEDLLERQKFNRIRLIISAVVATACFIFFLETIIESVITNNVSAFRLNLASIVVVPGILIGMWSLFEARNFLQKKKQIESFTAKMDSQVEIIDNTQNVELV